MEAGMIVLIVSSSLAGGMVLAKIIEELRYAGDSGIIRRSFDKIKDHISRMKILDKKLNNLKRQGITGTNGYTLAITNFNEQIQILVSIKDELKTIISTSNKVISKEIEKNPNPTPKIIELETNLEKLVEIVGILNTKLYEYNKSGETTVKTLEDNFGIIFGPSRKRIIGFGREDRSSKLNKTHKH